jgi:serine/threonine protein kinase
METKTFGRYEIRSELGRGGMATVYHAYDPNFERDVAIKVLPEVFLHDPQFRVRFDREAKMIALLEHPAIVPLYDFGESNGQPYIVMRYMSGGTLVDRLKQGPLSLEEIGRIVDRLVTALDAAHARGIIHRDIKPGNILFDQYGNAFLSDFGIAHLGAEGYTSMTGNSTLGTPAYMSPEQVQGDKQIDGRSDIYAVGVIIYQMLSGEIPYASDTPAKVMMAHVLQPVPHILDVRPDLPWHFDTVITTSMAKNPDDRYSTAGELSVALQSAIQASSSGIGYATTSPSAQESDLPTSISKAPVSNDLTIKGGAQPLAKPEAFTKAKKRTSATWIALIVIVALVAIAAVGLIILGKQGSGPLAMFAPSTATFTSSPTIHPSPRVIEIQASPSPTQEVVIAIPITDAPPPTVPPSTPTSTETVTPAPQIPVIGGADKIAFLLNNDVYLANLDGTDLTQLTVDGAERKDLQWLADGKTILYVKGKCVETVDIETTRLNIINCFNFTDTFKSFIVSPDGEQVALSIDNQLYLIPYNAERIGQVKNRSDLVEMAECKDFAPYKRILMTSSAWSDDMNSLLMKVIVNNGDAFQIMDISTCSPTPEILDNFPAPRFTLDKSPGNIPSYGFDGVNLVVFNNFVRNDGFGDLWSYNTDLYKVYPKINPINQRCCYRDARFSPDGQYMVFAHQNYLEGSKSVTRLYLIPYGNIGTGEQFTPLPLPDITEADAKPQPILRPAQ